jgi:hypothetical protein
MEFLEIGIAIPLRLDFVSEPIEGNGFVVDLLDDVEMAASLAKVGIASLAAAQEPFGFVFPVVDREYHGRNHFTPFLST